MNNKYPKYPKDKKYFKLQDLDHFTEVVLDWAEERNLLKGTDNLRQCPKLLEESNELLTSIILNKDTRDDIGDIMVVLVQMMHRDDLDTIPLQKFWENNMACMNKEDAKVSYYYISMFIQRLIKETLFSVNPQTEYSLLVTSCTVFSWNQGTTLLECCEIAFNDIKDRTGKMIDGTYVKD